MNTSQFWHQPAAAAWLNHLWQSTTVVIIAWVLTIALRQNRACVRYWVWLAASIKFLLPFSVLITVGEYLGSQFKHPIVDQAPIAIAIQQVEQPFAQAQSLASPGTALVAHSNGALLVLAAIWACGVILVAFRAARGWWTVYEAKRTARPLHVVADVPVLLSPQRIEPGVFGIIRPVLLLPEGILERLSAEQMSAIVAHEMSHVRRRDNLTFALHMIVETLFWFHPAVWWIGERLIDERERACDEAVVQGGGTAESYAEGILNVCKYYVESPVACVAGVTGADLKKRIAHIMQGPWGFQLTWRKKVLLGAVVFCALTVPMALGVVDIPRFRAQLLRAPAGPAPSFEVATIKPSDPSETSWFFHVRPTEFTARHASLKDLIKFAFKTNSDDQIIDGPDWMKKEFFDIEAKAGAEAANQFRNLPLDHQMDPTHWMVQSLLADRFRMKTHIEMKTLPVYALVLGKDGPKLKSGEGIVSGPNKSPENAGTQPSDGLRVPVLYLTGPHQLTGKGTPMNMLIGWLQFQAEIGSRTIVDETGLQGGYDFVLEGVHGPPTPPGAAVAPQPDDLPSIFTILQEQLGLKLIPKKAPVEVLVIDHVEQPTPN